ncbi:MAG: trigger factor [Candidatus Paceibacterota bacterium]|jgi:trigger factor
MTNTIQDTKSGSKSYESATIKKLAKSSIEIIVSISAETWEKFRSKAIENINESVTIDGFRKGMVPENILVSKVGEGTINEEMAELAIGKAYVDILIENKIDAIGQPQIQLTKLAKGNPLEFKAITAVVPEIKLPDYKKLAQAEVKKSEKNKLDVSDKDLEEAILKIRKSHALSSHGKTAEDKHEGHNHDKMSPEEKEKHIMDSLPEFNDEFVRGLGDFKDIEDFKKKVREIIGENKKDEAKEKMRIQIADAISDATTVELPDVMVESELDRTQGQFEIDIERMGVKLDDYLKHAKKTLEEIRKDWRPHAEKKAKLQLLLNAISDAEKIKPDQKEIENEVDHIVEHYKEADREKASVYAETVLTNEKVFQWLEKK